MNKFYINSNGAVESISLEELRDQLNWINGTTMPRGVAPKYEYEERTEYRVMQKGQHGYADSQYSANYNEQNAQDDLSFVTKDEPQRVAWINEVMVFVAGYNKFQEFNECQTFDTEAEAQQWIDDACDELIANDQERGYYDSEEDALAALAELKEGE